VLERERGPRARPATPASKSSDEPPTEKRIALGTGARPTAAVRIQNATAASSSVASASTQVSATAYPGTQSNNNKNKNNKSGFKVNSAPRTSTSAAAAAAATRTSSQASEDKRATDKRSDMAATWRSTKPRPAQPQGGRGANRLEGKTDRQPGATVDGDDSGKTEEHKKDKFIRRPGTKKLEDLPVVAPKQDAVKLSEQEVSEPGKHVDHLLSVEKQDFASLGLPTEMVEQLNSHNWVRPTSIQAQAIPPLLVTTRDALIKSETGSGKTLAYLLPVLHHCVKYGKTGKGERLERKDGTRALVLAPTRELVLQIEMVWKKIAKPFYWVICTTIMGGEKKQKEKARLRKGVHVVLGTPGRVLDHMETTSSWVLSEIQWFIMDEADRLLDLGFDKSIRAIYKTISVVQSKDAVGWREKRRNVLVSATLRKGSGVSDLAAVVLRNPLRFGFSKKDEDDDETSGDKDDEVSGAKKMEGETKDSTADDDTSSASSNSGSEDSEDDDDEEENGKRKAHSSDTDSSTDSDSDEETSDSDTKDKSAMSEEEKDFVLPSTLEHLFVPLASRHRLVALASFLRLQLHQGRAKAGHHAVDDASASKSRSVKIIVFVSTGPAVEFIHTLFTHTTWPGVPGYDGPLLDTKLWKLHGNMPQRLRSKTYQDFCVASEGILICTDVAARGLDLPSVNWVVQFDAPETVEDYIHRAGRTARIGHDGNVITFLIQTELPYLDILRNSSINLTEMPLPKVLGGLHVGFDRPLAQIINRDDPSNQLPAGAVLQKHFESLVESSEDMLALAKNAYMNFIRAYAAYPKEVKNIFHPRLLHLGEVAHSFALKERPRVVGAQAARIHDQAADLVDRINKSELDALVAASRSKDRPRSDTSDPASSTKSSSAPGKRVMTRSDRRAKYRPQTAGQDPRKMRLTRRDDSKSKPSLRQLARSSDKRAEVSEFL